MTDATSASVTEPPAEPDVPDQGTLALALPEDAHTIADWERAAAGVLRKTGRLREEDDDARVWDRLSRPTLDGIGVSPLGTPALVEGLPVGPRPSRAGAWDIRSLVPSVDAKQANEAALADLEGGVTSLWVDASDPARVAGTLQGVLLDLAPVVLDAPAAPLDAARALLAVVADSDAAPHPATNLGVDPVGATLRGLRPDGDWAGDVVAAAGLARELGIRALVVDATAAHDLGASEAQELGYALAVGVAYLRVLAGTGLEVAEAADLVEFRFAATDEQFPTIAKLRAARRLWARALELSGVASLGAPPQRQHAVTSRPMLSKYDPYTNMLRGTVAAFAAGVGGADAVTVLPFDSPLGRPSPFGRRIARNVNHLLIDESHVAAVTDPAGGAYAVERLTHDLAEAGWAELGRIEEAGDLGAGLEAFRGRVAEVVAARDAAIATRTRPITGVSEFPHLAESLPEREPDPANDRVRRYGAAFEELRDTAPHRAVFLATLGPVAQHTARATFATNLLAAGGVAVEVAGATTGAEDLAGRYAGFAGSERGSTVACLAGSDAAYAEWGPAAAAALRAAGADHVILAGRPDGELAELVDDSCATGVDALAFLTTTREKLR